VENAILTGISEKYAQELPKIDQATTELKYDLDRLKAGNDVIAAVNAAFGIITSIAALFT
jgi:hypothetical protein